MADPERPGLAGIFIRSFMEQGYNATQALRELREMGGTIRTQTWYRAWAETLAGLDRVARIERAPINRRPIADELSVGAWRTGKRFSYQVTVTVRDVGSGIVYDLAHPITVLSDSPITYTEALEQAASYAFENIAQYGEQPIGGSVESVWDREAW